MNFHGGPGGPYSAVDFQSTHPGVPLVNPMYYGLIAFTELAANYSQWLPLTLDPPMCVSHLPLPHLVPCP
jgi:hypothetical protein